MVLLIKKRSFFDRFISSIRIIDPSAIVRREVGTVASGVNSQEDLNSQQNYCFSADSCSPFFLGGGCSIQLSCGDRYKIRAVGGLWAILTDIIIPQSGEKVNRNCVCPLHVCEIHKKINRFFPLAQKKIVLQSFSLCYDIKYGSFCAARSPYESHVKDVTKP